MTTENPDSTERRRDTLRNILDPKGNTAQSDTTPLSRDLSPTMRRDAAITLLTAWREGRRHGLTLNECSTDQLTVNSQGDIQFDGYEAFVETGSAVPPLLQIFYQLIAPVLIVDQRPRLAFLMQRADTANGEEFLEILRPAWRITAGLPGGQRLLRTILLSRFAPLLLSGLFMSFVRAVWIDRKHESDVWLDSAIDAWVDQLSKLETLRPKGKWTGYYDGIDLSRYTNHSVDITTLFQDPRECAVFDLVTQEKSTTVLDIAANQGLFSLISARAGHKVVAIDNDVGAVDRLYRLSRDHRLPIRPAVVDFLKMPAEDQSRFRCPVVLALGFTHHLYLVEGLAWSEVARRLAAMTGETLITEFKVTTDAKPAVAVLERSRLDDYRLEAFASALKSYFANINLVYPEPDANRVLLVCKQPLGTLPEQGSLRT